MSLLSDFYRTRKNIFLSVVILLLWRLHSTHQYLLAWKIYTKNCPESPRTLSIFQVGNLYTLSISKLYSSYISIFFIKNQNISNLTITLLSEFRVDSFFQIFFILLHIYICIQFFPILEYRVLLCKTFYINSIILLS